MVSAAAFRRWRPTWLGYVRPGFLLARGSRHLHLRETSARERIYPMPSELAAVRCGISARLRADASAGTGSDSPRFPALSWLSSRAVSFASTSMRASALVMHCSDLGRWGVSGRCHYALAAAACRSA